VLAIESKMRGNADVRCSAPPWQCASEYSCSYSSTAGEFNWELFDHHPHSLDLVPSDLLKGRTYVPVDLCAGRPESVDDKRSQLLWPEQSAGTYSKND
jgi:hypothetical protein